MLSGLRIDELPRAAELAAKLVNQARKLGACAPAPHARDITPMRCSESDGVPNDPKSIYELKLDGVRILAERNGEHAALRYRTGRLGTATYPEVVRAMQALGPARVILDGEVVAFDERGRPSFARLTRRIHEQRSAQIRAAMQGVPVMYFAFVGNRLITRGRVGSGLDVDAIARLSELLAPLTRRTCAAEGELFPAPEGRVFVEPRIVVSVEHAGFTPDGRLRHPVYRDVRDDVAADQCIAAPHEEREAALIESASARSAAATQRASRTVLTNSDKVFWPEQGITKGNLCEYYAGIADTILPYLRDRPVLMVRYPDGIEGKHFYQWNAPAGTPEWIKTQRIHSEEHARDVTFFRVEDLDTLLYIANLGCIPLHVLATRFSDLERCDFLTIDFDVGEARFADAVTLTLALRDLLAELGLAGYPKTSGQTGLHVLVPLAGAPFTLATTLAALLGSLLHKRHPGISTIERRRARRPVAVYIDTGQTGTSRAIVAPYSVRAHPGATVSTPLLWDEVGQALSPARFDLFSVPRRVSEHGDPMHGMLAATPDLERAVQALGELLPR